MLLVLEGDNAGLAEQVSAEFLGHSVTGVLEVCTRDGDMNSALSMATVLSAVLTSVLAAMLTTVLAAMLLVMAASTVR